MVFDSEAAFEDAVVEALCSYGWGDADDVIVRPTEQQLIANWASILFDRNKHRDRLNDVPLSDTEMAQIIGQLQTLRTPLALSKLINGEEIIITRDSADDDLHRGKNVALKIFDPNEIAGGSSRYQIVRQPVYAAKSKLGHDRRGDLMLLINGMPLFHIELKKSGVPVSEATGQIEKYAKEGVFTGLFSLVQIFVAMNPDQTLYFANPGPDGAFNEKFQFHWADFNNNPVNHWKSVVKSLLSIPMAHQLIGYYTVADDSDGVLKVMRSYQYYAASRISDRVTKVNRDGRWGERGLKGGHIWHTTGSGKTMTSFKCAQLIAASRDADKVVFLVDRIELGTQSLEQYQAFANEDERVQETKSTDDLRAKLRSDDPADTLIVTSIQKMGNLEADDLSAAELAVIRAKRLVFIVDECHRSTFGKNMETIHKTFPAALLFGFTGTPIHDENNKKLSTTVDVFGDELHRYSIADGIRDGNVLGFDTYLVTTFPDTDVREAVALGEAKASSVGEALADPQKARVYNLYMGELPMGPWYDEAGTLRQGVESKLPEAQYGTAEQTEPTAHQRQVVADIVRRFPFLSRDRKFHAIFATHSIPEALDYYRLLREADPTLAVTVLVDPSVDNEQGQIDRALIKQEALEGIIADYNERYGTDYDLPGWARFKLDVSNRLSHKRPYLGIDGKPEERLDILIVVDQMLTGFDSKWVNTLFLDKVLRYEMIIQAFSRTNRLFNESEKPFGNIRYYRRPHTMKKNIEEAVALYSGDKPFGLFVPKLEANLVTLNETFDAIKAVFASAGVEDLQRLPDEPAARAKFASLFRELDLVVEAAKVQGFSWEEDVYVFDDSETLLDAMRAEEALESGLDFDGADAVAVFVDLSERDFLVLAQRYKELSSRAPGAEGDSPIPYDLRSYLMEIDTTRIDHDYMNENFDKWRKQLELEGPDAEATDLALAALHKSFSSLSQEEQKYAMLFIHDVQSGDAFVEQGKTFRDYVTEYQRRAKDEQVTRASEVLGVDPALLSALLESGANEDNIDEFGRFERLMETLDRQKAREYFSDLEGSQIPVFKVGIKADKLLRDFVLEGGFDL
ncbi:type I restriction endonuclease subunit R, EcoR124 family [Adlercreutzia faecimuris]|uniref:type I site-specific deoxyribonuclease n=1 Tax=Adlercreutzia faecimuris TaxID=2897341 RepID=A0ABS9WGX7_9ACTN|nr:DEAD/DEAH box helicase family protein [Adlercreutzia sp. JBNU-10]MCI2241567.1 DEAD/DEAH box helicase family protein [Adlercreutzia sp. JBNU-10]